MGAAVVVGRVIAWIGGLAIMAPCAGPDCYTIAADPVACPAGDDHLRVRCSAPKR